MTTPSPRLAHTVALATLLALAGSGCGGGGGGDDAGGGGRDTGTGGGTDTGTGGGTDSGPLPGIDSGVDAGQDAFIPADTGGGGTPDMGTTTGRTVPVGHCGAQQGLYFPESSWIYTDVHDAPTRTNSAATVAWVAAHGGWGAGNFQIDNSFIILDGDASTPRHAITGSDPIGNSSDCDPGIDFPVPTGGRIEGYPDYVCPGRTTGDPTDDCHLIVADFSEHTLFEAYQATFTGGQFYSSCNLAWDMTHDSWGLPPAAGTPVDTSVRNWGIGHGCTGPDAAGFPMAPLLITIGDVMSGHVEHVIRFTLPNDRIQSSPSGGAHPTWVWPATHAGGPTAVDPDAPVYGSHWRLHDSFDPAAAGLDPTNPVVQAVVWGLQHYGMVLADGGNVPIMVEDSEGCGTTWDDLWGSDGSHVLGAIDPTDFDVLETGGSGAGYDCMRNAAR